MLECCSAEARDHELPAAHFECNQIGELAHCGQPPSGHNSHAAAEGFRIGQHMRTEKHRAAAIAQPQYELSNFAAPERIEPRHRLIEEDQFRLVENRLRDANALQHPFGKLPQLQPTLRADAHVVQQLRYASLPRGATITKQGSKVFEQLLGGEIVVEVRILWQVPDAAPDLDVADRAPQNLGPTGCRVNQLHQQLERGGLAGTVWSEEAKDLPFTDFERQCIERDIGAGTPEADAIMLGQRLRANCVQARSFSALGLEMALSPEPRFLSPS